VRDELNQRLDDGEVGQELVAWLNALPEVQTALATHFGGRAITEQNLSVWKQGGFADWLRHQEARDWADRVMEASDDFETAPAHTPLAEYVAVQVLMELVKQLEKAREIDDATEQRHAVLGVAQQVTQLRRADYQGERTQMERERLEMKQEQERRRLAKEDKRAADGARIKADFFPELDEHCRPRDGSAGPSDIAICLAACDILTREAEADPGKSNPIQPNGQTVEGSPKGRVTSQPTPPESQTAAGKNAEDHDVNREKSNPIQPSRAEREARRILAEWRNRQAATASKGRTPKPTGSKPPGARKRQSKR
jgi:hypothetical protein